MLLDPRHSFTQNRYITHVLSHSSPAISPNLKRRTHTLFCNSTFRCNYIPFRQSCELIALYYHSFNTIANIVNDVTNTIHELLQRTRLEHTGIALSSSQECHTSRNHYNQIPLMAKLNNISFHTSSACIIASPMNLPTMRSIFRRFVLQCARYVIYRIQSVRSKQ